MAERVRLLAWAAALVAVMASPASGAELSDPRGALAALRGALSEFDEARRDRPLDSATALLTAHGFGPDGSADMARPSAEALTATRDRPALAGDARPVTPGPGPVRPAQAEIGEFRTALTLLSQGHTLEDTERVIAAQGPRGAVALSFRDGLVTPQIIDAAMARLAPPLQDEGRLRLPILLWPDTVLRLTPGQTLRLSRADGVFILSLGRVEIDGATLAGTVDPNPFDPEFRPFLAVGGGGALRIADAQLSGLGFGWSDRFAGVAMLKHPFMAPQGPSAITGSRLVGLVSVVLSGTDAPRLDANRFVAMRDNALRLRNTPGATVAGNLFEGNSPTNAIRLLDNSHGARVTGNVMIGGARAGVLVSGGSDGAVIAGNHVWRRGGGGIKVQDSACVTVTGNRIVDGGQKGIEIRNSPDVTVADNFLGGNDSGALWISAQPAGALTRLHGNVLVSNGSGLATASPARLHLAGNDLTEQLPRVVSGDIAGQNRALIRDLRGRVPMLLTSAGATPGPAPQTAPCTGMTR